MVEMADACLTGQLGKHLLHVSGDFRVHGEKTDVCVKLGRSNVVIAGR